MSSNTWSRMKSDISFSRHYFWQALSLLALQGSKCYRDTFNVIFWRLCPQYGLHWQSNLPRLFHLPWGPSPTPLPKTMPAPSRPLALPEVWTHPTPHITHCHPLPTANLSFFCFRLSWIRNHSSQAARSTHLPRHASYQSYGPSCAGRNAPLHDRPVRKSSL